MKKRIVTTILLTLVISLMNKVSLTDQITETEWKESALKGDPIAAYNFGRSNVIKNKHKEAIEWLMIASDSGIPEAEYLLGILYEQGLGTEKDPAKAFNLYNNSASKGLLEAQNNLAAMYYDGRGTDRNIEKALFWVTKAAEGGLPNAQYYLGNLYKNGTSIPKDDVTPYLSSIRV